MRLPSAGLVASASILLLALSPAVPSQPPTATETPPPPVVISIQDMLHEAGELMDLRHWDEAIQLLTLALEIEPNNGLAYANRSLAFAWTNRLDEAARDLAAAEQVIPGRAIIHRVRAIIAGRRSDEETELAELSKSLELEPGNPMALSFRARILQSQGKEAEALADAEAFIKHRPGDPDAYHMKADILRAQQKFELAGEEAKRLASLFPGNADAMSTAAWIHSSLGDRTRALQAITSAITEKPRFAYYYKLRAMFRRWDDVVGRRKDLEAALALQPNDLGAVAQLALLEFQQQRWSEALALFSVVMTLEPKDYGVLAYRAMTREKMGDSTTAERDYAAAMRSASGPSDFQLICEALAFEGVALERALAACNRAIELDPEEGSYRSTRGLVRLRLGLLDQALADFDFAVAADKREAHPFYGRALTRWRKGDRSGAIDDLRRARSVDPPIDEKYRRHGLSDLPQVIEADQVQSTE